MDIISEEKNLINKKNRVCKKIKKTLSKASRSIVKRECQQIVKTDDSERIITQTPFTAKQTARRSTNFHIESVADKIVAIAH